MNKEGPIFSVIVRPTSARSNMLTLPMGAKEQIGPGQVLFTAGPEETPVFTGTVRNERASGTKPVVCRALFNETNPLLPEMPLKAGDKVLFEIKNGRIHILSIVKDAWCPAATTRSPRTVSPVKLDLSKQSPPPKLPENPGASDLARAIVLWMQEDPFQRVFRRDNQLVPRGKAPVGKGWDFRLREFTFARSWVALFPQVLRTIEPIRERFKKLRGKYDWNQIQEASRLDQADLKQLNEDILTVFDWVESRSKNDPVDFGWAVFASAVTGTPLPGTPMTAKWSRVAALASEGLPNQLTGWDSRIATSAVWRLDQILAANEIPPDRFETLEYLRIPLATGGSRPRKTHFRWLTGFNVIKDADWVRLMVISDFVQEILAALNDPANKIPRMPMTDGGEGDWDMLGLNLVLYMDGF